MLRVIGSHPALLRRPALVERQMRFIQRRSKLAALLPAMDVLTAPTDILPVSDDASIAVLARQFFETTSLVVPRQQLR